MGLRIVMKNGKVVSSGAANPLVGAHPPQLPGVAQSVARMIAEKNISKKILAAKKATTKITPPSIESQLDPTRHTRMANQLFDQASRFAHVKTNKVSVAFGALKAKSPTDVNRILDGWLEQYAYERAVHEQKGMAEKGVLNEAGRKWVLETVARLKEKIEAEAGAIRARH